MAKKKKVAKKPVKKIAPKAKVAKKIAPKPAKKVAKKATAKKPTPKKVTAKALPKKKAAAPVNTTAKVAAKPPKKALEAKAAPAPKKGAKDVPAPKGKLTGKAKKEQSPEIELDIEISEASAEEVKPEDIVLTDAEGRRYCRVRDCDQIAIVDAYCRYHYLLFWKKIQVRKKILTEGKLQKYIEDLTARYPDKFLEILRKDLRSEKDFMAAIMELELDEASNEDGSYEDEDRSFIDEVRGVTDSARGRDEDEY